LPFLTVAKRFICSARCTLG